MSGQSVIHVCHSVTADDASGSALAAGAQSCIGGRLLKTNAGMWIPVAVFGFSVEVAKVETINDLNGTVSIGSLF